MNYNEHIEAIRIEREELILRAEMAEARATEAEQRTREAEARVEAVRAALNLRNDPEPLATMSDYPAEAPVEDVVPVTPTTDLSDLAAAIGKVMGGTAVQFDQAPAANDIGGNNAEALSDEQTFLARVTILGDYLNYANRWWEITGKDDDECVVEYEEWGGDVTHEYHRAYSPGNRLTAKGDVPAGIVLLLNYLEDEDNPEWEFELDEGAVLQALTYKWQTVSQLYTAAQTHGYSKGISTIRNIMNRKSFATLGLQDRFPTLIERGKNAQGHLAWRLIGPVNDDPDGGETVEEPAPESTAGAMSVDFSKRKRCPTAMRTARYTLRLPDDSRFSLTYFWLPKINWAWSRDGRAEVVARSHPFYDWWFATAVGDWMTTYDAARSFAIVLSDPADIATMLSTGMAKRIPSHYGTYYSLDISRFDAELAEKKAGWKANAAKAQRNATQCPRYARTVFRDTDIIKELESSPYWHAIKLPKMKRVRTCSKDTVIRDHPTKPGAKIQSPYTGTVLKGNDTLQRLWDIKSHEWIITAPPLMEHGYGSTTVEDAVLWARDDDDVLFKAAL